VTRRVCDLENLVNEEAIAPAWLQRHVKKIQMIKLFITQFYPHPSVKYSAQRPFSTHYKVCNANKIKFQSIFKYALGNSEHIPGVARRHDGLRYTTVRGGTIKAATLSLNAHYLPIHN
jgi:hypothetical protein